MTASMVRPGMHVNGDTDDGASLGARRTRLMGPGVPTFHDPPLHLVEGQGVWLRDASGRRYLDCYNNVPHVGHGHPHVVAAIAGQLARLNIHNRYLHEGVLDYIERLTATMGHDLTQALLACTGSEANDVALRMARAVTGHTGLIATDNTYHGNTSATSQLGTRRPPIGGFPDHVRLVPAPESPAPAGTAPKELAEAFGRQVARAIDALEAAGHGFAGMILCPVFANEGVPRVAPGFFAPAQAAIRAAGGLVICDEVQSGFGRCGTMWGHERLGIVPDVVTLGKPMGNGYPVAGVVTRPDVMAAFRGAFGYFNTFGGTPVAAAAGMAVLDVIEREGLVAHAARAGAHARERLAALRSPLIAEHRGAGLMLALVLERNGVPATDIAQRAVEAMRRRGVLIGRIGREMNILKIRPPLPITLAEIDFACDMLQEVLGELGDRGA
ncbi:aspartate aminotransferase family protein [Profundibacterium mesophilum]|uniref:Acetylornithine aminotransferase n=1 Tax=Profundibacterium mesophilum KAUST100406-0324 TaxID=1037889 RepID=A0A921NVA6_9RHOB|nr:aspartate aminotransferase family protein [Profundibacterium mesophilum]KAF0675941.1 acetylornithine aminotransferase [Profundibacterium mesophilum KAUST100406-0324]